MKIEPSKPGLVESAWFGNEETTNGVAVFSVCGEDFEIELKDFSDYRDVQKIINVSIAYEKRKLVDNLTQMAAALAKGI